VRGDITYAIKGDWEATKGLRKKWRERKQIQARRTVSADEINKKIYHGIPPTYLRLRSIGDRFGTKPPADEPKTKPVIAIDMRCLDGASRFRGIGQYLHGLMNLLLPELTKQFTVIIYIYNKANLGGIKQTALDNCEVIEVKQTLASKLPAKVYYHLKSLYPASVKADALPKINQADLFIQTYVEDGLPKKAPAKTITIAYDLIPLLFADYYFGTKGLGRRPKGWMVRLSRKLAKRSYVKGLERYNDSDTVVAISEHTKKTLVKELGVAKDKIEVSYPGVPEATKAKSDDFVTPSDPYIVYIGGIDYRRDLVGLIESFEILRAKENYKLVLAGRDFEDIHDKRVANKLKASKFKDDIIVHGYIAEHAKHALMRDAVALVYPTLYEGFGIPVVEAFQDSCPVITYSNSSVVEAGGDAAIYAETPKQIAAEVAKLSHDKDYRKRVIHAGLKQHKNFTWRQAAEDYHNIIEKMIKND